MVPRVPLSPQPGTPRATYSRARNPPGLQGAEGRRIPIGAGGGELHGLPTVPLIPPGISAEPKASSIGTERSKKVPSIAANTANRKDLFGEPGSNSRK